MGFEAPEPMEIRKAGHHMVDMITSICALCMSAISIFMVYRNGHDMEKLVHANSWPVLQLESGNAGNEHNPAMEFALQNSGIGPARIHTFDFLVDGVAITRAYLLAGIVEACCAEALKKAQARSPGPLNVLLGQAKRPIANTFLSPREMAVALRWARTDVNQELWQVVDAARHDGHITMRACYCSVFDECWVAENNVFPPREVKACGQQPRPSGP